MPASPKKFEEYFQVFMEEAEQLAGETANKFRWLNVDPEEMVEELYVTGWPKFMQEYDPKESPDLRKYLRFWLYRYGANYLRSLQQGQEGFERSTFRTGYDPHSSNVKDPKDPFKEMEEQFSLEHVTDVIENAPETLSVGTEDVELDDSLRAKLKQVISWLWNEYGSGPVTGLGRGDQVNFRDFLAGLEFPSIGGAPPADSAIDILQNVPGLQDALQGLLAEPESAAA